VRKTIYAITLVLLGALIIQSVWGAEPKPAQLLNASYDVSREVFTQINPAFAAQWKAKSGQTVTVRQSHGQFLYSDAGQEILAKNFFRVRNPAIAQAHAAQFPAVHLVAVEDSLGGWDQVIKMHFAEGGILDQAGFSRR
jgi:ABC-type sulfate transport system substrate-binding protein